MRDVETEVRNLIREYDNSHWNDAKYLAGVFDWAGVQAISAELVTMLRSGDRQLAWEAEEFAIQSVIRHVAPAFTEFLPKSGVYEALRDLLYIADSNMRSNAIHAIGKMSDSQYVPILLEALPVYLERYPLELPGLIFEIFWLSRRHRRRRRWEHYNRIAASPSYLVRWSLLEILGHEHYKRDERDPVGRALERTYTGLTQDGRFLVAAEAEHKLALLRHSWEGPSWPRDAYRQRKRQLEQAAPRLIFATFNTPIVSNYLHASGQRDYDLPMLDAFARFYMDNPITAPFDYAAYGRAFETWRTRELVRGAPA